MSAKRGKQSTRNETVRRDAGRAKQDALYRHLGASPVDEWQPWELDPSKLPKRPPTRST